MLNAKDYGVPQNRERVYMVSILNNKKPFIFPEKQPLKKRLKDILETNVDKKYFLELSTVEYYRKNDKLQENIGNGFRFQPLTNKSETAKTVTTKAQEMSGNLLIDYTLHGGKWEHKYDVERRIYNIQGIAPTLGCDGREAKIKVE